MIATDEPAANRFENIALKVLNNLDQRWKLVAILVSAGKPISIATNNLEKSHPLVTSYFPHRKAHAEIRCIRNASWEKVEGSSMFVWRIKDDGTFGLAKPCPICTSFLKRRGIKKIGYSTSSGFCLEKI